MASPATQRAMERQRDAAAERKSSVEPREQSFRGSAPEEAVSRTLPTMADLDLGTGNNSSRMVADAATTREKYQGTPARTDHTKYTSTGNLPPVVERHQEYSLPNHNAVAQHGGRLRGLGAGIITPPRPSQHAAYPGGQPDVNRIYSNVSSLGQQTDALLQARTQGWYQTPDGGRRQLTEEEFQARKQVLADELQLAALGAERDKIVFGSERERQRLITEIAYNQQRLVSGELRLEAQAENNRHRAVTNVQREQQNQFRTIDQGARTVENVLRSVDRSINTITNFGKR